MACVAKRLIHVNDIRQGVNLVLDIRNAGFRAEALIFALSPMPKKICPRHGAVAKFERNRLEELC